MCNDCVKVVSETLKGKLSIPCITCKGSGNFIKYVNSSKGGFAKSAGTCFACAGKGNKTFKDMLRTETYYNHRMSIAV